MNNSNSTNQKNGKKSALARQAWEAIPMAVRKLDPRALIYTPVMFLVEVGAAFTLVLAILHPSVFSWSITAWLWFTAFFATLAEAIAEGRGKAQAASLRATRTSLIANRVVNAQATTDVENFCTEPFPSEDLRVGDVVLVSAGEQIPADGDVIFGAASVDESAVTGESAPVIREAGGDRCAVTGGTRVLSDQIAVRVSSKPGESFIDRMIALVEGASRKKTPNEMALSILLIVLSLIFLVVVIGLGPAAAFAGVRLTPIVYVALLICLIPTTIGALLSAIGIAGMDRLVQHNVLAMSGRAVEAAGDVSTLLLDKTGTITVGDRQAVAFEPAPGIVQADLARACQLASAADETPEGRSIMKLARELGAPELHDRDYRFARFIPFTAKTRMSGVLFDTSSGFCASFDASGDASLGAHVGTNQENTNNSDATVGAGKQDTATGIVKGAAKEILALVARSGNAVPEQCEELVESISRSGGTALGVAEIETKQPNSETCGSGELPDIVVARMLGIVHLKDIVKDGVAERFAQLRTMGIRTVMITGDNELTARAIAREAGVDDVLAEATPDDKMALIKREQAGGHMVAMTGDGTNDAPALAQADVGVAMNTGTSAAKEAGNMVDLDSDPTKLIDIVHIGKQLLITRGALTTFSIANDVAKYFAIIPAMFVAAFPGLEILNVMHLHSSESAILSAVIFNALIIVALIPLSLRGVKYRPGSAANLLARNLAIFGLGGLVAPFIGIKIIDLVVGVGLGI
ncbi:K+-transporting ATPase ATPase B chain [Arcanobacterium pluranimalium]|uniref:potassium-transporting ATPase subunit KdpB n=1 Tax=Arcanobacterium pluranimalium TaxID=108028 RepID=UPI0019584B46|nr:HAD-IC family P-type ATPase [Arcanobacterium pluranimalium]MBM7824315.1 K+-transporting ATPase ATPase B chain [Arcanobacterium pluranimalium]